jgi:peptidoglycan/xylan/chitin deacetylase (PgdA/CDA1 family)
MRFTWPNGAKCVVALSVEYDAESVEWGYKRNITGGDDIGGFSTNFGIPRMLEVLAKYDVRSTFFVPAWDAERNPSRVREIAAAGHEIAAHGYIHEDFSKLDPQEEIAVFQKAHEILSDIVGTPPRGFRAAAYASPISLHTLQCVKEMGYLYDSSFMDDDEPYRLQIEGGPAGLVEIPWVWVLNDISFMGPYIDYCGMGWIVPQRSPQFIIDLWKEEFDSLYEAVGFFNLVVHPRDMGRVSRIPIIEELLTHISGYNDVWFATYGEISEVCLDQFGA